MKKLNVKPVEELSQFINEANTPGNLLQDVPDFDAIKQEEYENEGMNVICEKVGYADVKYFTKCFIKYTGLKPGEYRKIYS